MMTMIFGLWVSAQREAGMRGRVRRNRMMMFRVKVMASCLREVGEDGKQKGHLVTRCPLEIVR